MNAQQLIDTVIQMQERDRQMRTQMEALTQQLQQQSVTSQQRETQLQAQVQAFQQQVQAGGNIADLQNAMGTAFNALAQSQQTLVNTPNKASSDKRVTLIDTKGLAKPEKFDGSFSGEPGWRPLSRQSTQRARPSLDGRRKRMWR